MLEIFKYALVAIFTSSITVVGSIWFLKLYFKERVSNLFSEREKLLNARIKLAEKYEMQQVDNLIKTFPKIQETVYRCRLEIKGIIASGVYDISQLTEHWEWLSEQLVIYQLQLPENLFDRLHLYKNMIAKILLRIHSEAQFKEDAQLPTLNEDVRKGIQSSFDELDNMYKSILQDFRNIIHDKYKLLK